jgi:CRISPR-associated endonuclease Csn1
MGKTSGTPDLELAFDVGHSSIGWAVLNNKGPGLLGCGAVIFPADDCLASQRRAFRRQRRHIRATRLRIVRLKRLLAQLGVLTNEQLDTVVSSSPWLLAARVLRGGEKLSWAELWDVLRWYAHNRGYDGNKGWSRQDETANSEDTEKEQKANEELKAFRAKHGREGSMAEVFCDRLGLDPLAAKTSSPVRFRDLGAAFPREGVEAEVERILRAQGVEGKVIVAIMRDHTAVAGPDYRLPARYGQRVNGARTPGGLLFGQLVPRFENRIIATCPVQFQREYERVFAATGDANKATHEAEKLAKVPGIGCVEFHRFRWAMQLANVTIATGDARKTRRLSKDERLAVNAEMERLGALTPKQFRDLVRAQTKTDKDNLDRLLALPDADKSLVLDPARKLAASGVLGVLWPHLGESLQKHTLTNLRRGKSVTARVLLEKCPAAQGALDHWWDGEAMKTPRKTKKNPTPEARTRDQILNEPHSLGPMNGRAAHSHEVMDEVWKFVLSSDGHPMDPGAPLFRSEAIRRAQLERAIDEQTNNHLVRHRLRILVGETDEEAARHPNQPRLNGLFRDLVNEYAGGDKTRVERITIEVNRNLKELSGKSAQEQAKEQGQQTAQFRSVEKKLAAAYEGLGVKLGPGLIRKGRIAEDLGWKCPYTGASYDELDLLHRRMDKDHIIPRSQRMSDSLDSLVITFPEINTLKDNRTAVQFVAEFQSQPVPGLPHIMIKPLTNYLKDVDSLETFKGHGDDQRRKKNRQRLLRLRDYVEKEFTPGDLTKTSQLVRLGAEALQRAYLNEKAKPTIVSLPGSVTGAVRKSWNLAGCLEAANKNVMNSEDLDDNGKPRVHRKTELRGITHLHHALDASTLAITSHLLPCDGGVWKREVVELLSKRRCNPTEQAQLRHLLRWNVTFTQEGQPVLGEITDELRKQLRTRLEECRVVQHLPAEWGGLPTKETVWRVFDPKDSHRNAKRIHRWLKQAKVRIPDPDNPKTTTVLLTMRKRRSTKDEEGSSGGKVFRDTKREWKWGYCEVERSKVLGLGIIGDKKLRAIKGGKLIDDNYGMALFPNAPKGAEKFRPIRFFRVWEEMERLKIESGGKRPPILRRGHLIRFKTGPHAGKVWRVLGLQDNGLVRFFEPDTVRRIDDPQNYKRLQITSLLKDGLEVVKSSLCGVAQK